MLPLVQALLIVDKTRKFMARSIRATSLLHPTTIVTVAALVKAIILRMMARQRWRSWLRHWYGRHLCQRCRCDRDHGGRRGFAMEGIPAHARYDFAPNHESELALIAGEPIEILDDQDRHWWLARKHRARPVSCPVPTSCELERFSAIPKTFFLIHTRFNETQPHTQRVHCPFSLLFIGIPLDLSSILCSAAVGCCLLPLPLPLRTCALDQLKHLLCSLFDCCDGSE